MIYVVANRLAILNTVKAMQCAGDALQTLAFQLLSSAPMPDVTDKDRIAMIAELSYASGLAVCGGQALDLDAEGKQVDLESLERIHQHKTGH